MDWMCQRSESPSGECKQTDSLLVGVCVRVVQAAVKLQ